MVKRRGTIKNTEKADQHTGVILEHIDSKVDLLVEGNHVLDKKIDTLHGEMNERFKEVDYKFGVVFDELHLIRSELKVI